MVIWLPMLIWHISDMTNDSVIIFLELCFWHEVATVCVFHASWLVTVVRIWNITQMYSHETKGRSENSLYILVNRKEICSLVKVGTNCYKTSCMSQTDEKMYHRLPKGLDEITFSYSEWLSYRKDTAWVSRIWYCKWCSGKTDCLTLIWSGTQTQLDLVFITALTTFSRSKQLFVVSWDRVGHCEHTCKFLIKLLTGMWKKRLVTLCVRRHSCLDFPQKVSICRKV